MPEATPYLKPRRIWVEDGHVYAEGHDGAVLVMDPKVAIELGRLLEQAGTESFINKVLDRSHDPAATVVGESSVGEEGVANPPPTA